MHRKKRFCFEVKGRLYAAQAALDRLEQLEDEEWARPETIERVAGMYRFRIRRFKTRAGKLEDDGIEDQSLAYQRLMHDVYSAQRQELLRLRNEGEISADVMRRLERELDLEESRLEV